MNIFFFFNNYDNSNNFQNLATKHEAFIAGVIENDESDSTVNLIADTQIKQEDEEEQRKKRQDQMRLLEKAAEHLRRRLGMNDILDGELAKFQEILINDHENMDETIEPLIDDVSPTQASNSSLQIDEELNVNGRAFDSLSGYVEYDVEV